MILAEADWLKLAGGVVFVIFWLISALAGTIAKKKQEAERRRSVPVLQKSPPPLPSADDGWTHPTAPTSDADRRASAQQNAGKSQANEDSLRKANKASKAIKVTAQAKARAKAEAQVAAARIIDHQRATMQAANEVAVTAAPIGAVAVTVAPRAADVRKWLSPNSLRRQMVLAEVIGPPLALREPRY